MKRILFFIIVFTIFILCSCDLLIQSDIKVINNCNFTIRVTMTNQEDYSFKDSSNIPPGSSYTFMNLPYAEYRIDIHTIGSDVPSDAKKGLIRFWSISRDETWTITWDEKNKYKISR